MTADDSNINFWVDLAAGWCSGAVSVIACQPIDTILTRLQAQSKTTTPPSKPTSHVSTRTPSSHALLRDGIHLQIRTLAKSGYQSLWRGSSAMISAVPFQNALLMAGYGVGKRWSETTNQHKGGGAGDGGTEAADTLFGVFVGGCTGGIVQSFLMSPVELIKVSQQVSGVSATRATSGVVKGLVSHNRLGWCGLQATLLRDGIPHGVWFASYEWCKGKLDERYREDEFHRSVSSPVLSGAFAASVAWGVGYPFDIIKTRIQASSTKLDDGKTLGIVDTTKEIVRESNGRVVSALYRGFTLKLARAIPASAIGFFVYESVKGKLMS